MVSLASARKGGKIPKCDLNEVVSMRRAGRDKGGNRKVKCLLSASVSAAQNEKQTLRKAKAIKECIFKTE